MLGLSTYQYDFLPISFEVILVQIKRHLLLLYLTIFAIYHIIFEVDYGSFVN